MSAFLFLLVCHPVGQRPRRAFVDLGDEFGRRGVLGFYPGPLFDPVNVGQRLYASARMCAELRLPDDYDFAVGVFLADFLLFHAAKVFG